MFTKYSNIAAHFIVCITPTCTKAMDSASATENPTDPFCKISSQSEYADEIPFCDNTKQPLLSYKKGQSTYLITKTTPVCYQNLGRFTQCLKKSNYLILVNEEEKRILLIHTETRTVVELSGLYRNCSSNCASLWVESWVEQKTIHRLYRSSDAKILVEIVASNTPGDSTKFDRLTITNGVDSYELGHGSFCSCRFFSCPDKTNIKLDDHIFSTDDPLFGVVAHAYNDQTCVPYIYYFNAHTGQLEYAKKGRPYSHM